MASGPEQNWKKAVSICDSIVREQAKGTFPHEQALFSKAWLLTVHDQGQQAVRAFDELATAYPEKCFSRPSFNTANEPSQAQQNNPERLNDDEKARDLFESISSLFRNIAQSGGTRVFRLHGEK